MPLPAGRKLGPYEIVAPLGSGGMGEVYRARDTRLGRSVAVKILRESAASWESLERFRREARAISSLNHPNICTLYDVGEESGRDFIVMEYLEGETLAQRVRRGRLSLRETAEIAAAVGRGLAHAHAHGVVHRDVKPGNIFLTKSGVPKIIDFGLARLASTAFSTGTLGTFTGTIGYMSPEQTLARPVDARTDVWATGVILIEMLTGTNPFQRESPSAILFAIVNEAPAAPREAPVDLQKIVYRALSKNPAGRYADSGEMAEDLETFLASVISSAGMQTVDLSAPTMTLGAEEMQKYIEPASASALPGAVAPRKKESKWWLSVAVVPMLAVLAFTIPVVRARIDAALFGRTEKHIAVLPFENIGNSPSNAPLAEGLMDSLTAMLSNLDLGNQSLWVVPSSLVRARKVTDPSAALRKLGATLVVEGSIDREGQAVHLTVNLINAKTLRQIGSTDLEDPTGNLAALQDEAVARIAKLMGISVSADLLKKGGSANPAAYQSYLTALGYIQRYDKTGNLDRAIAALNSAVNSDPSFALGYAEMAEAYRLKYAVDPNQKWIDAAIVNCDKAVQLEPNLPAVYITLGRTQATVSHYDLALEEFQRALHLDPHNADAVQGLAGTYERMGRNSDAEATFKRAIALRPDYWDGYDSLGLFYDRQRRYQDAIEAFHHAVELTPDNAQVYSNLATVYLDSGESKFIPQAEEALRKSIALSPSYFAYANLGIVYYNEKRYAESAATTEKALQFNDENPLVWDNLAIAYEWLNEKPKVKSARTREIALLEEQAKSNPQDALTHSTLAICYAEQGRREQALTHVQSSLALAPIDATILVNAGETYEDLGERSEALRYVEKGLRNGYPLTQLQNDPGVQPVLHDPRFRPDGKA
ncbi:MAG TPA: protein kinase [Candidatus Acidoferrum sp.]|nr:protein kinase [Candidatus Acidoferrum sp.]